MAKTPDLNIVDRVATALETMDRRLGKMEADSADMVALTEAYTENSESMTSALKELREMFLSQAEGISRIEGMLSNYVEATRDLRQTTVKLHSEVREKLKAVR